MPVPRHTFGVLVISLTLTVAAVCSACSKKSPAATPPSSSASPITASSSSPASSASSSDASSAPAVASGIDPLTGSPPSSPAAATRPALAIKVDNVAGAWPQAGLNQADIVFDIPVEGGLTRLLAVFHSQDVPLVGPIRSARPADADILHLFGHPYFAFSGGTPSDLGPIESHSNATMMWWDVTPSLFVTRTDHAVPHQVFATTKTLYAGGQARSPSKTPPPALFGYSATPPASASKATSVVAHYSSATAAWSWDGTKYLRTQDGHADLLMDGSQVSASDVVVLSVKVAATAAHDSHGSVVPLPETIGSGTVWVFRNGVMVQGTWSRPKEDSPMKLTTVGGQTITLAPGRAWVELLPNDRQPQVS